MDDKSRKPEENFQSFIPSLIPSKDNVSESSEAKEESELSATTDETKKKQEFKVPQELKESKIPDAQEDFQDENLFLETLKSLESVASIRELLPETTDDTKERDEISGATDNKQEPEQSEDDNSKKLVSILKKSDEFINRSKDEEAESVLKSETAGEEQLKSAEDKDTKKSVFKSDASDEELVKARKDTKDEERVEVPDEESEDSQDSRSSSFSKRVKKRSATIVKFFSGKSPDKDEEEEEPKPRRRTSWMGRKLMALEKELTFDSINKKISNIFTPVPDEEPEQDEADKNDEDNKPKKLHLSSTLACMFIIGAITGSSFTSLPYSLKQSS